MIYNNTWGQKENLKEHANIESNMFLTYILKREPIQVTLKQSSPPQIQLSSFINETVLHNLVLKMVVYKIQKRAVCKMTICKIQIARGYGTVCKTWVWMQLTRYDTQF